MPRNRRIVVDASIARSAGREPSSDIPGRCRAVLEAFLALRHLAVLGPEGLAEWKRHRSSFARTWLVQMFSRRKVVLLEETNNADLRRRLTEGVAPRHASALEKDAHLIEAALLTDRIVISRDEKVRGLCAEACARVGELKEILWANPDIEDEEVTAWLEAGARVERKRKLGDR